MRDALIRLGVPEDPVITPDGKLPDDILLAKKYRLEEKEKEKIKAVEETEAKVETGLDADMVTPPPGPEGMDMNVAALLTPLDGLDLVARRMVDGAEEQAMPNLIGMTKRQAREQLQRLQLPMDVQGAGWVIAQDPPAGAALQDVALCALRFGDRMVATDDADEG